MSGTFNCDIEKVVKRSADDYLYKNGSCLSNEINYFVDLDKIMISKGSTYPFLISNKDLIRELGTYWWNALNLFQEMLFWIFVVSLD